MQLWQMSHWITQYLKVYTDYLDILHQFFSQPHSSLEVIEFILDKYNMYFRNPNGLKNPEIAMVRCWIGFETQNCCPHLPNCTLILESFPWLQLIYLPSEILNEYWNHFPSPYCGYITQITFRNTNQDILLVLQRFCNLNLKKPLLFNDLKAIINYRVADNLYLNWQP